MGKKILLVAQFELQEGKLEEVKALYQQGIKTIKEKEPDVQCFNLHISRDKKMIYSVEVYKNSEAILEHFELSSERIPKFLQVCKVAHVEIYGDVSDEVKSLLSEYGANFYDYCIGYER